MTGRTREMAGMKIYVNRVPAEGVREETTYDPNALDVERFDAHPEAPIRLSSFIRRVDRELIVEAAVRCALQLTCARCLHTFTQDFETTALLTYEVSPTDVVDVTEDVRQEIILAYPMIPVCQPGCKGLCAVCGQNLNVATCDHQQE